MSRTAITGIVGLVLLLAALGLNFWLNQDEGVEAETTSQAEENSTQSVNPEPTTANENDTIENDSANKPPEFDVVRIAENGDTVIAGRGTPQSEIFILDGPNELGSVTADANGEWVFLPNEPLPSGSRELSLKAILPDGSILFSENVVILIVPESGLDIAGRPSDTPSQPLALLVPRDGTEGVSRVLQKPSIVGSIESESGDLSLDSVDYDDDGKLSLSGRGLPGFDVQVYVDNEFIGDSKVQPNGLWQMQPKEKVDPGVYNLRIDESKDKKVVSRLELPFSRAEPLKDFANTAFIVVQPGNSLWRIARRTLGEGMSYSVLYDANQEQIRDPNLIYPGQIFEVPAN